MSTINPTHKAIPIPNPKPLSQARDADARHTVAALHRAAEKARRLAALTHTPLIVVSQAAANGNLLPTEQAPGMPHQNSTLTSHNP